MFEKNPFEGKYKLTVDDLLTDKITLDDDDTFEGKDVYGEILRVDDYKNVKYILFKTANPEHVVVGDVDKAETPLTWGDCVPHLLDKGDKIVFDAIYRRKSDIKHHLLLRKIKDIAPSCSKRPFWDRIKLF